MKLRAMPPRITREVIDQTGQQVGAVRYWHRTGWTALVSDAGEWRVISDGHASMVAAVDAIAEHVRLARKFRVRRA